jgi:hypothetical protein
MMQTSYAARTERYSRAGHRRRSLPVPQPIFPTPAVSTTPATNMVAVGTHENGMLSTDHAPTGPGLPARSARPISPHSNGAARRT